MPKVTYYTNIEYSIVTYDQYGIGLLYRTDNIEKMPVYREEEEVDEIPSKYNVLDDLDFIGHWSYWRITDNRKYIYVPLWIPYEKQALYYHLCDLEQSWKESSEQNATLLSELRTYRYKIGFVM